jgi:hypothetical protein
MHRGGYIASKSPAALWSRSRLVPSSGSPPNFVGVRKNTRTRKIGIGGYGIWGYGIREICSAAVSVPRHVTHLRFVCDSRIRFGGGPNIMENRIFSCRAVCLPFAA